MIPVLVLVAMAWGSADAFCASVLVPSPFRATAFVPQAGIHVLPPDSFAMSLRNGDARGLPIHARRSMRKPAVVGLRSQEQRAERFGMNQVVKGGTALIWPVYLHHVFLSDFPCGPGATGDFCSIGLPVTMEAINLSINFWFITPLVFGSLAPVVHPGLEGLFNIVVAWGLLFAGFLSDGRGQRVPMLPFMVGTAFLTNVFLLPYLFLRQHNPGNLAEETGKEVSELEVQATAFCEKKAWPLAMLVVFLASVAWGCFGRGEEYGDIATRFSAVVQMATSSDRLAHSFLCDSILFSLFQGVLIGDDMKRRNFTDEFAGNIGRFLPYFGLIYYQLVRPPLPEAQPGDQGI